MKWKDTYWKKEKLIDYKFDFIDIDEFYDNRILSKLSYITPFLILLKTILMYCSDIWTTINLVTNGDKALELYFGNYYEKWFAYIFYISLFCSIVLVAYEMYKSYKVIHSKDISIVFTNVIAHRLYILSSYNHFCFFEKLASGRTITESITFFIFFTLKGWKRFLLVDIGREALKSYIFTKFLISLKGNKEGILERIHNFSSSRILSYFTLISLAVSNLLFILTILLVLLAAILYIPLVFKIRGNLKEYCCHEIDKRISKLLLKQRLQRQNIKLNQRINNINYDNINYDNIHYPSPTLPNIKTILPYPKENSTQYSSTRNNSYTESNSSFEFNNLSFSYQPLIKKNSNIRSNINSPATPSSTSSFSRTHFYSSSNSSLDWNYYRPPPSSFGSKSTKK